MANFLIGYGFGLATFLLIVLVGGGIATAIEHEVSKQIEEHEENKHKEEQ